MPSFDVERFLLSAGARSVAGADEVGRGAWAGPVVVCAAVAGPGDPPEGLTDSKLLTPERRGLIADEVRAWASYGVGQASVTEIDELGMTEALNLAASRALAELPERPDMVILDGKHDYLGRPAAGPGYRVRTETKADLKCVTVAAASVLAKVYRDSLMADLGAECPAFGFADNAGYPSPMHQRALASQGPTRHHRLSWSFMDDLPEWRHLKKYQDPLRSKGQVALF